MKRLTDKGVAAIRPDPSRRVTIFDSQAPGLAVRCTPNGRKSYAVIARVSGTGKQTWTTIGRCGALGLAEAREEARRIRALADSGIDPRADAEERQRAAERTRANTVETCFERYAAHLERRGARSLHEIRRALERDVWPDGQPGEKRPSWSWRGRPIASIDAADVQAVLDRKLAGGAGYAANRLRQYLSAYFEHCRRHARLITENPARDIPRPTEERERERVLSDDELRAIWLATERLGYPFGPFVRLLLLTGQRRNEAAELRRDHLANGVWTIPSEASKNREPNIIPLPPAAVDLLDSLPGFSGPYLFTTTGGEKPISGFAKAKARLDHLLAQMAEAGECVEVAPWRFHDLRRTLSTGLARLGVPQHVNDAVLNHVATGALRGVARTYNRYGFLPEKRAALEAWGRHVEALVAGTRAKVVELHQGGARA